MQMSLREIVGVLVRIQGLYKLSGAGRSELIKRLFGCLCRICYVWLSTANKEEHCLNCSVASIRHTL